MTRNVKSKLKHGGLSRDATFTSGATTAPVSEAHVQTTATPITSEKGVESRVLIVRYAGSAKGHYVITDDFDAPLFDPEDRA